MLSEQPILEMKHISKSFPGVRALEGVHFRIFSGEAMALVGENGAGKSTLMKILSGVHKQDKGDIFFNEKEVDLLSPKSAMDQGIATIHQELNLIPHLSVGENIFLGREPVGRLGRVDWKKMHGDATALLDHLKTNIRSQQPVAGLSIGDQQIVEIAKALSLNAKILILDEPTDTLTDKESENLFRIVGELTSAGKALVYISHRLSEIFKICNRVTVLRDGQFIAEKPVSQLDEDSIIEMMVGRRLEEQIPFCKTEPKETLFKAKNLSSSGCKEVSFSVHKGEVVGIAGLMGAGRTELALTIYGAIPSTSGSIEIEGSPVTVKSPQKAIAQGISYVSEDRKQLGLFLKMSLKDNITLPVLKEYAGLLLHTKEKECGKKVDCYISDLSIKTSGKEQPTGNLSGGNQQKVAISRGIITRPKLLILDEPTRGVDVGAKKEIYKLINELKANGLAILMISSEMPELLGISDRILVMRNGAIEGELSREEANQEAIMRMAVGIKERNGD